MKLVFGIFLALVFSTQLAMANSGRVALVIGNSEYEDLTNLRNPTRDAASVADEIANLGFTVYLATDLTKAQMDRAFALFQGKAQAANTALVFFAGHASAIEDRNFLHATDFNEASAEGLNNSISIREVYSFLGHPDQTNLIFVDACQVGLTLKKDGQEIQANIISPRQPPENTFLAFASASGAAAHDGTGIHSLFTGALLDAIATPNIDVEVLMRQVSRNTFTASQGQQKPQVISNLSHGFVFNLDPTSPVPFPKSADSTSITQTGFSNKTVLLRAANGVHAPSEPINQHTKHQEIIGILCKSIRSPKPKICDNLD